MPPYLAWVDPWQGEVDSANLLATLVGSDPLPDISISRIPVNSISELNQVINKTIAYSQAPIDEWHRHFTFGVDNTPDPAGDFVTVTEELITDYIKPGWVADRVYLDDFVCNPLPPYDCPAATTALINRLNITGTLVLNYSGHGGINFWASEQLLSNSDISSLSNGSRLPVILSLDCLDGYWLHPNLTVDSKSGPGLIEEIVRVDQRGAVAAYSPTGLGVSTGHDALHRGFYDSLFQNGEWRLGPATIASKVALYATNSSFDLIHTFTIFGDPALEMPNPYDIAASASITAQSAAPGTPVTYTIHITNTGSITDTALVTAEGAIWQVDTPADLGLIAPGDSVEAQVRVNIPQDAIDNATDMAVIQVVSQGDRQKAANVAITTTAHPYGVSLAPNNAQQFALPGSTTAYELEVTNVGGFPDTYDLTISGNAWPTTANASEIGPLDPGQKALVTVEVDIPADLVFGAMDIATVQITSQNDLTRSAQASLWSSAYFIFLPNLRR